MRLGGQGKSTRIATIAGLILAGIALGIGFVGNASAVDDPKHKAAAKKNAPAKGKPVLPGQKQFAVPGQKGTGQPKQFAPLQKQITGTPGAGPNGVATTGPGASKTGTSLLSKGPFGKNATGQTATGTGQTGPLGKGATTTGPNGQNTALSKGLTGQNGQNPNGKGPGTQNAALTKAGPNGLTATGKGANGPTGSLSKGPNALGKGGQTAALSKNGIGPQGLTKGPVSQPGFGKSALTRTPVERQRLVIAHRTEIFTARLRLPPRPLPGQRGFTGVPPVGETRFVARELVLHIGPNVSPQALAAVMQRQGLTTVSSQANELTGGTVLHLRYNDGRQTGEVVRSLETENIGTAQPDYVYTIQQEEPEDPALAAQQSGPGDFDQYVVGKLHLDEAHRIATGANVLIAVIDSQIDVRHPDISGTIAEQYDAVGRRDPPDNHGTGMAGAIVAHSRLMGIAPGARILAVRAFSPDAGKSAQATTRSIIQGLEWAIKKGARVINMSFAGPYDPMLQLAMKNAHDKGVILIAASGNSGPKSPPLYPAADPNVIAVTATDENDRLFSQAVRGPHVAVAAPGVEVVVPAPNSDYQLTTGTSVATAHVSGVAALLVERYPQVDSETILEVLTSSARRLNPKGRDDLYGWGLVDPSEALAELEARINSGQMASPARAPAAIPAAAKQPATAPKQPVPKPASVTTR
jgi:subtilase family protein